MRIRNRKVPFPLSSLSPVPLSDPPFSDLLPLRSNTEHNNPSDQPNNSVGDGASCRNSSDYSSKQHQNKFQDVDPNGEREGGEKIGNHSRKETIWGAKTLITPLHQGEINVKKRRKTNGETEIIKEKKMRSDVSKSGVKKRGRGGAVMEGSRCSRVNGRGWRCCQPTLVGYSLCEHHLGKGRLRSMTSVPYNKVEPVSRPLSIEGEEIVNGDEMQQKQPAELVSRRRKHKIGMVKARSMSSLLSQADNSITSIADNETNIE